MAVDTEELQGQTEGENPDPDDEEDDEENQEIQDDSDYRVYNVRVHRSVNPDFNVATALQLLASDKENFGVLHFNHRPAKIGRKSKKLGPATIVIDTVEKRRVSTGIDPEAQKLLSRLFHSALRNPETGPKLNAVLEAQQRGQEINQADIVAALDPVALAAMLKAIKPREPRKPKAEAASSES